MEAERRKAALVKTPAIHRGPVFYFVAIMGLAILGLSLINMLQRPGNTLTGEERKIAKARQGADTIAEAMGRFRFHAGVYPETAGETGLDVLDGISALVMKEPPRYPKAVGPYLRAQGYIPGENGRPARPAPIRDPWDNPYIYELGEDDVPLVLSTGPDGKRGTPDDIAAAPAAFEKPFKDVSWTNDWVRYTERGIIVRPTPEGERRVEDRGEHLIPWIAAGTGGAVLALCALLLALYLQSKRGGAKSAKKTEENDDGRAS